MDLRQSLLLLDKKKDDTIRLIVITMQEWALLKMELAKENKKGDRLVVIFIFLLIKDGGSFQK